MVLWIGLLKLPMRRRGEPIWIKGRPAKEIGDLHKLMKNNKNSTSLGPESFLILVG